MAGSNQPSQLSENDELNEIMRRLELHEKEQREIFEQMKQNKMKKEEPKLIDEKDRYVDVLPVRPDYIDFKKKTKPEPVIEFKQ